MNCRRLCVLFVVAGWAAVALGQENGGTVELLDFPSLPAPTLLQPPKLEFPPGFGRPFGSPRRPDDLQSPPQDAPESPVGGVFSESLQLAPGPIDWPVDQPLAVRDDDGQPVVGWYEVGAGTSRVVRMPDGRLRAFEEHQTKPTDDPFTPLDNDELRDRLLSDPRLAPYGFKAIQSRRFLFLYNTSDLFIEATRGILESMFPAVVKYFGRSSIRPTPPEHPLVVIAFATEDQFQEFKRMPAGVVAYYDTIGNHVVLHERSRLSENAPEIAVQNAISTIAHEGVHQMLHNIGVQQRLSRWPMWLSEGLPEYFAPTDVSRRAKWSGLGAVNQLRMHEIHKDLMPDQPGGTRPGTSLHRRVAAMMDRDSAERPTARTLGGGQTLRALIQAERLDSIDYAYSWGLIHMLARRHRRELFDCIAEASTLQPLAYLKEASAEETDQTADQPAPGELFEKHFGNDYAKLEAELLTHLRSLPYTDPAENQTHYIVLSGSQVLMTTSPAKVRELKTRTSPLSKFQVRSFPNRTSAIRTFDSLTR